MKIVLIGNIQNGIGLQRDAELLEAFLISRGHMVACQPYDKPAAQSGFDLAIFLETISEHLLPIAKKHWIFINPEWLKADQLRLIARHCELVLAKTQDAAQLLRKHFDRVKYTGFLTQDRNNALLPRVPHFLHIGGNSGYRGTNAIISAWREFRYWDSNELPHLTVISNSRETVVPPDTPGIRFHKRVQSDQVISDLMNTHLYHLLPSAYEGWGHALHESQSVGAILLTTNAPPMNEIHAPFTVHPYRTRKASLATIHDVFPQAIREMIPKMLDLPSHEIARMQIEARARFEKENKDFAERFDQLLHEEFTPAGLNGLRYPIGDEDNPITSSGSYLGINRSVVPKRQLRIALLGNLHPPHSTENDLKWTLQDMGHTVIPFQENESSTDEILKECTDRDVHLLLYIHTHGWETHGRITLDELWNALRSRSIRTASFHLDRYWGLNASDKRQDGIGKHAFWHTDKVFTADGGNQQGFSSRGVAHVWLPPGVCKRDVSFGRRREDLEVEMGFVGAEGYHSEYGFRGELVSFLRSTYGERFRLFQGYRGQSLNDLYASISVVVGDSCFGGADRYWSDRVPETLGRGGFLLHPAVDGLRIPGLVTFEPQNLSDLQSKIDYYLQHPEERNALRCAAHHWVKEHETYHNRMHALLREMDLL